MAKVLIAESVDVKVLDEMKQGTGVEFVYRPEITVQELEQEIAGYDGLIVRPKQVTETAIRNADKLQLVIRGGAGVNSIALEACKEKKIIVENTPGLNSDATAEFTIALMLQLFRRNMINKSDEILRQRDPGPPEPFWGTELRGKKIGLVGMGNIGFRVATIAEAFGMDAIFYVREQKKMPYEQIDNLREFLTYGHDVVSLHIPLTSQTKHFFKDAQFNLLKKGTILVNTARPQLIEVESFARALESGIISGFGIDGDYDLVEPFAKVDKEHRGIITHHIADCTVEAQANITRQALKQAIAYFEGNEIVNRVV